MKKNPIGCRIRCWYRKEGSIYVCMYCGRKSKELTYSNNINKQPMTRKNLIRTILDLAGDELKTKEDLKSLALATEDELIQKIMDIAYYYKHENNELLDSACSQE